MRGLHRRRFLLAAASLPAAALAAEAPPARLRVLMLSDLHSAYGRMPALLEAMRRVVRRDRSPALILLNGDLFEHGNVAAQRSDGALDWRFLAALTRLAPVALNVGNHEADLTGDAARTVARARALGITVVSDITDVRTGMPLAPSDAIVEAGGPVRLVGLATNALDTYPAGARPALAIPAAPAWIRAHPPVAPPGGRLIVMSHAGLAADRQLLPLIPDGALVLGGHDHLTLQAAFGRTRYVHTGAWGSVLTVATFSAGGIGIEQIAIDPQGPADGALKAEIIEALARTLTPAETAVVADIPMGLSLADTGRAVAAIMARATGSDVGFMGHTTLGMGLPAGPLTRFDYDAVVRFDGTLMRTQVDPATLAAIVALANQDRELPLDRRTGDFAYASPIPAPSGRRITIVTTDWCAKHQGAYFGREDLAFSDVAGLTVKAAILDGLNARRLT